MMSVEKRSAEEIVQWVVGEIAKLAGIQVETIDVHEPITSYLVDSRDALSLAADLEAWLGAELAASIVWDHPTIASLAEHVAADLLAARDGEVAPLCG